jgi:hypothetical protein
MEIIVLKIQQLFDEPKDVMAMTSFGSSKKLYLQYYFTLHTNFLCQFLTSLDPRYPRGHLQDLRNQRKMMDNLAIKFNIQKPEDWYKVNVQTVLQEAGGSFIKNLYGGSLIKGNNLIYYY